MHTTVIDYGAGNLTSVLLALSSIGVPATVARTPEDINRSDRIIFPGVGAAGAAMRNLINSGTSDAIRGHIAAGRPFLGICIGMQLLFDFSEEDGGTPCMGLIPGSVTRFRPASTKIKIPHMGWNEVTCRLPHPVFEGIPDSTEFYFVHSYYPQPADETHCIAETSYSDTLFASSAGYKNVISVQFHPERSGRYGLTFLKNFISWNPQC